MTLKVGCLNNEAKKFDQQSTVTGWLEAYRGNYNIIIFMQSI